MVVTFGVTESLSVARQNVCRPEIGKQVTAKSNGMATASK